MGSFGMDWKHKASVLWDWENLLPIGANGSDNPKMTTAVPQAQVDAKFAGLEATGHESVHSYCGTFSSSSEMGYSSSKSSVSASADSSPKTKGNSMELNFAPDKKTGKKTDLGKVDDARTSPSSVIAIGSGEPVLSLKLGKRTYFEDVCGGQSVKTSLPSDTSAVTRPPASAKKAKAAPKTQKSYCQVEGCKVDLSSAKEYHRKHKVCQPHSKAPKVVVAGLERRFCQQCSRFHGLAEFDKMKKSCRRRLNDHNARRRKPQPEALSFGSSRLSAMFYDTRQQTSLLFGQGPYGQMRSCASSSWNNPGGGFNFAETKAPWLRAAGVDGLHLSSQQVWNNFMPHGVHQDFDGFTAFKGTSAKVLDQGVEASVVISNPNGAPDLQRALSLLSNSPASAGTNTNNQPTAPLHHHHHHHHAGLVSTLAVSSSSVMQASSPPGLWQDSGTDAHARFQALGALGSGGAAANIATTAQELLQLPRPPLPPSLYDSSSSSYYDLMR